MKIIGKGKNKLVFKTVEEVFAKDMKSPEFRRGYEEELARLRLIRHIREMREAKKMSQEKLAQKVDMPQSVIARIESGRKGISLATLTRIARAFNKEVRLV